MIHRLIQSYHQQKHTQQHTPTYFISTLVVSIFRQKKKSKRMRICYHICLLSSHLCDKGVLQPGYANSLIALLNLINLNQQMSDQEVAFDDWQAEAEAVVEQVKNQPPKEAETQEIKVEQPEQVQKEKVEAVDPRVFLLQRINQYRALNDDKFQDYVEDVKAKSTNNEYKGSNQILKNDKDFAQFAKSVGKRLNDQTEDEEGESIEENCLFQFMDELIFQLYPHMEWKNLVGVKEKLNIVKKERKNEEVIAKKQKEKEERLKKAQKAQELEDEKEKEKEKGGKKIEVKEQPQDIFDGATFVNSKQVQDQLKNKPKEQAPKPVVADDDDDFM